VIKMTGHDRIFEVPRSTRNAVRHCGQEAPALSRVAAGRVTAWDLLDPALNMVEEIRDWRNAILDSVLAAAEQPAHMAMGCTECEDTGYLGLSDPHDPDTLVGLVREVDAGGYQMLVADGGWSDAVLPSSLMLEVLSVDLARDVAAAVLAGGALVRRYYWPRAFLPPESLLAASPGVPDVPAEPPAPADGEAPAPTDDWAVFAIVDELDTGAVIEVIRIKPGPELERYEGKGVWVPDPKLLTDLQGVTPPPLVELDEEKLAAVLDQVDQGGGGGAPEAEAAAALVADAPLTVSPDPRAEKLRRYWSTGKGAAKIRWGTPGDWKRCVQQLTKHMGARSKGYCQNLHKRSTGVWTGDRRNPGRQGSVNVNRVSQEESLVAAIQSGLWAGVDSTGRTLTMTGLAGLKDGLYEEMVNDQFSGIVRGLTAGAFPVNPPVTWFQNPDLKELTPTQVEDSGQVWGHLASFDMPHIGLPGNKRAPRSRTDYAYFRTGAIKTDTGRKVPVGQLTLVGGHASMYADAGKAVAHYDNTQSAVADVAVGEDRYGIWFAGALRPDVSPEQVRAFMASSLSGDWRPINGNLEMVACCAVNVPGFPIARTLVAGGVVTALVAAGAREIAIKRASMTADAAIQERVAALETAMSDLAPSSDPTLVTAPPSGEDDGEPVPDSPAEDATAKIARIRQQNADRRRAALRERVHGTTVAPAEKELVNASAAGPKA
jgi:hypothetical protein